MRATGFGYLLLFIMRLVLIVLVIATGTAHAQFGNPYPATNSAVDTALSNYVNNSIIDLAIERRDGKGTAKAKPAVRHEPLSASDFKPGKGRPVIDAFFARAKIDFMDVKDLRAIVDSTFIGRDTRRATISGYIWPTRLGTSSPKMMVRKVMITTTIAVALISAARACTENAD